MEELRSLTVIFYDANPLHLQKVVGNADCVMIAVSREYCATHNLYATKELTKPSVYVLTDEKRKVYIGQARQFADRVKDHLTKKDWWTKAYVFVSDSGRYDAAHIEYLEYLAIREAQETDAYDWSENKQTPNNPTLRFHERNKMSEAFQEIKFLLKYERCFVFIKTDSLLPITHSKQELQEEFSPPIFYVQSKGCVAKGHFREKGSKEFVLLKGSKIRPNTVASFKEREQRNALLKHCTLGKEGVYILNENYQFDSPSGASSCCLGRPSNGWNDWKDANGNPLKTYKNEVTK